MIWFSAEPAGMCTKPSACGPTAMPARRKIATSGILILCANSAASVPTARMSPQESRVCFAISMEEEASTAASFGVLFVGRSDDLPSLDLFDGLGLRFLKLALIPKQIVERA